jgi:aspartyl-tRNA(Asn)/glutamyl-tRNA(Gln) amidotransferase subunit C
MADSKRAAEAIDVRYVAHLARLDLTEEEARQFQGQLDHILDHFRQIRDLPVADVEPTAHAVPIHNVFREDAVRPGLDRDRALANAPAHQAGQFMVPKIVE